MANANPSGLGSVEFNLRFPGQYFDKETNTHYNYYRDYSPEIGRYIESDPIGLAGGVNTYAYVGGKPLSVADPLGLDNPGMGPYEVPKELLCSIWLTKCDKKRREDTHRDYDDCDASRKACSSMVGAKLKWQCELVFPQCLSRKGKASEAEQLDCRKKAPCEDNRNPCDSR